ncbi:hypothetical protein VTK73DRAFT_10209 [Phialemonium thermophilum]|uniref:Uncharacterized protein n=1 Tax=Phialemonium thermophilum TaxID=223376 RepID=A0ABR3VY18_9PEZI
MILRLAPEKWTWGICHRMQHWAGGARGWRLVAPEVVQQRWSQQGSAHFEVRQSQPWHLPVPTTKVAACSCGLHVSFRGSSLARLRPLLWGVRSLRTYDFQVEALRRGSCGSRSIWNTGRRRPRRCCMVRSGTGSGFRRSSVWVRFVSGLALGKGKHGSEPTQ